MDYTYYTMVESHVVSRYFNPKYGIVSKVEGHLKITLLAGKRRL